MDSKLTLISVVTDTDRPITDDTLLLEITVAEQTGGVELEPEEKEKLSELLSEAAKIVLRGLGQNYDEFEELGDISH